MNLFQMELPVAAIENYLYNSQLCANRVLKKT